MNTGGTGDKKFCRACGRPLEATAVICPGCGSRPGDGRRFCGHCGAGSDTRAIACTSCGRALKPGRDGGRDWLVALLFSFFLGGLAVDRFYLGYVTLGILKLVTFAGFGLWWAIDLILIACNRLPDAEGNPLHRPF